MENLYQSFLVDILARLTNLGFVKKGASAVWPMTYGRASVVFQKSRKSTNALVLVTADIQIVHSGVSKIIYDRGLGPKDEPLYVERLGIFKTGEDYWWSISSEVTLEDAAADIETVIERRIVPTLNELDSEQALFSMLQVAKSPGLTRDQRLAFLAAYYRIREMREELSCIRREALSIVEKRGTRTEMLRLVEELWLELGGPNN